MSANGLEVFDKTLQTTNTWLKEIGEDLGGDRRLAWRALSAVLHRLRDRLPLGVAAHLGAELPMLVRGVYYDQFQPARLPGDCRDLAEFLDEVQARLVDADGLEAGDAVRAVFAVLSRHVPQGQIRIVKDALPQTIRAAWTAVDQDVTPPPRQGEAGRYQAGAD